MEQARTCGLGPRLFIRNSVFHLQIRVRPSMARSARSLPIQIGRTETEGAGVTPQLSAPAPRDTRPKSRGLQVGSPPRFACLPITFRGMLRLPGSRRLVPFVAPRRVDLHPRQLRPGSFRSRPRHRLRPTPWPNGRHQRRAADRGRRHLPPGGTGLGRPAGAEHGLSSRLALGAAQK
jgi:hypothetical protein